MSGENVFDQRTEVEIQEIPLSPVVELNGEKMLICPYSGEVSALGYFLHDENRNVMGGFKSLPVFARWARETLDDQQYRAVQEEMKRQFHQMNDIPLSRPRSDLERFGGTMPFLLWHDGYDEWLQVPGAETYEALEVQSLKKKRRVRKKSTKRKPPIVFDAKKAYRVSASGVVSELSDDKIAKELLQLRGSFLGAKSKGRQTVPKKEDAEPKTVFDHVAFGAEALDVESSEKTPNDLISRIFGDAFFRPVGTWVLLPSKKITLKRE